LAARSGSRKLNSTLFNFNGLTVILSGDQQYLLADEKILRAAPAAKHGVAGMVRLA
jgi:hypothetical protein